jgi:hypothetical protein
MQAFKNAVRRTVSMFMILVFTSVQFAACSGGGGGDAPPPGTRDSTPQVLESTRYPGQFVTIEQDAIRAGQTVPVTFQAGEHYRITVNAIALRDGAVQLPTPPYLAAGAEEAGAATVSLSIPGHSRFAALTIQAPEPLIYTPDIRPGFYLQWWLQANVEADQQSIANIDAFETDTRHLQNRLLDRIAIHADALAGYGAGGSFTVHVEGVGTLMLREAELRLADQLLVAYCAGLLEYLEPETPRFYPSLHLMGDYSAHNSIDRIQERTLQILRDWRADLRRAMAQSESLAKVFLGFVAAVASLGALYAGGTFALAVGGLAALGYVLVSGIHAEGLDALSSRLGRNLGDLTAQGYSMGTQIYNYAYDAMISFGSNLASGLGRAGDLLNDLYVSLSTLEAERQLVCDTLEPQHEMLWAGGFAGSFDIARFCRETQPEPLSAAFGMAPAALETSEEAAWEIIIAGGKPIYKVAVNWGDYGTATHYSTGTSVPLAHAYADNGTFTVTAAVTDIAGQTAVATAVVAVGSEPIDDGNGADQCLNLAGEWTGAVTGNILITWSDPEMEPFSDTITRSGPVTIRQNGCNIELIGDNTLYGTVTEDRIMWTEILEWNGVRQPYHFQGAATQNRIFGYVSYTVWTEESQYSFDGQYLITR